MVFLEVWGGFWAGAGRGGAGGVLGFFKIGGIDRYHFIRIFFFFRGLKESKDYGLYVFPLDGKVVMF